MPDIPELTPAMRQYMEARKSLPEKTILLFRMGDFYELFFEDAKLVNNVRGVQGYTGKYHGKRVSVMASGMGCPSIGIYSYELFNLDDNQQ